MFKVEGANCKKWKEIHYSQNQRVLGGIKFRGFPAFDSSTLSTFLPFLTL